MENNSFIGLRKVLLNEPCVKMDDNDFIMEPDIDLDWTLDIPILTPDQNHAHGNGIVKSKRLVKIIPKIINNKLPEILEVTTFPEKNEILKLTEQQEMTNLADKKENLKKRFRYECYYCNKIGHKWRRCYQRVQYDRKWKPQQAGQSKDIPSELLV